MKQITCCVLAMLISVSVAIAQDAVEVDPLVTSGFRLGKFHVSSVLLAGEMLYVTGLANEMGVALVTDENFEAGVIDDDDISDASLVLAYAIWRAQFMILPLCEGGLDEEAMRDPMLADLRDPLQEVLIEVQQLTTEFMDNADFASLTLYCEQLEAGGYMDRLVGLSEEARALAGELD